MSCSARKVAFATDTVGESASATVEALEDGEVAVLENVRFNDGRDQQGGRGPGRVRRRARGSSPTRSSPTASASCTASRRRSTTSPCGCRTPWATWWPPSSTSCERLTADPERPYAVVLGGSKVSDKLGVIDNLLDKADKLLIGGGMVFTFLKALGHEVGKSLLEEDQLETCRDYLARAEESGVRIVLPTDVVVDTAFPSDDREPEPTVVPASEIPADSLGLDIGPESATAFAADARRCADRLLERADGGLRDRRLRRGDPRRRRGDDEDLRPVGRRRRGLRGRRAQARVSTRPRSGTSRPVAARAWSTSRARTCPASPSSTTD